MEGSISNAGTSAEAPDEATIASALVDRISKGDSSAEGELYQRYSRALLFMLKRRCGDEQLAEDLHQEAFIVVLARLRSDSIKQPERLAGFIQSTGRNLLIGRIRRRIRRQTNADSDTVELASDIDQPGHDQTVMQQQLAELTRQMLKQMNSERDRAILRRHYIDQEPKDSICSALKLTDLHFNRVLYRAKKRFRELLESSDSPVAAALIDGYQDTTQ